MVSKMHYPYTFESNTLKTCREEHPSRYNSARPLRRQLCLTNISKPWHIQVLEKRLKQSRAQRKVLEQVFAFQQRMIALRKRLRDLYDKHEADPSSVTIADWDDIARGSERKVLYIYTEFDRSEWPKGVPYPNMIAMRKWQKAEIASLEKEKDRLREKHEAEMAGLQKQGDELRQKITKRKRVFGPLKVLVDRVNAEGEGSVSLKKWEDALEGTYA
jgi:hypothetical protein